MLEQVLIKARGLRIPNHALRRLIAAVAPSAVAASVPSEGPAQGRQEAAAAAIQSSSFVPVLLRLAKFSAARRTESGNAAVLLRHAVAGNEAAVSTLAATALTSHATVDINKCSIRAHPSVIATESRMHAGCRKTRKIKRRYAGCSICPQ